MGDGAKTFWNPAECGQCSDKDCIGKKVGEKTVMNCADGKCSAWCMYERLCVQEDGYTGACGSRCRAVGGRPPKNYVKDLVSGTV